jgi:hypothetical protein
VQGEEATAVTDAGNARACGLEPGGVHILNVGEGDRRLTFDAQNPADRDRAQRIITDMLKQGYAVLVRVGDDESGPVYRRATGFDPRYCEYVIPNAPEIPGAAKKSPSNADEKRQRRSGVRVSAGSTSAIAVAPSAGGMSDRAGSIERRNLERVAGEVRNALREAAVLSDQWAGIPLPIADLPLVIEPRYLYAAALSREESDSTDNAGAEDCILRNRFYSTRKRRDVVIWTEPDGSIQWGFHGGGGHHLTQDLLTMSACVAWGAEQETRAQQTLSKVLPKHAYQAYLMTGMFLEQSARSGVYYIFRRLRPTVAVSDRTGRLKILAVLCAHPIGYYAGTWAGAMCPTDDVLAHLMLMRADEVMYWRRCNQHPPYRPEAGV